jgi:hypothetical protein
MKIWLSTIFILVLFVFAGCSYFSKTAPEDDVVARVGDKVLLRGDLALSIPFGLTQADSALSANNIIQRWVKQELMLQMAEENLDADQRDVQQELDEYRNSLIIHRYQQQLLSQKMDTTITEDDIRNFYDTNPEKFKLEQSIVKAIYIEIPRNVAKPDQIRRWMLAKDDRSRNELENYSFQFATKYDHFNDQWIDFNRIIMRMPFRNDNPDEFLRRNNYYTVTDLEKCFFLYISDFRLAGEKAPYDFVKDRIESLILNNRKLEFIQELEKHIYQKGKDDNKFEIIEFK